jgi:hypothetical protein
MVRFKCDLEECGGGTKLIVGVLGKVEGRRKRMGFL